METLIHQTRFSVRIVTIDFYLCPLEEVAAFGKAYANINVQPSQSQSTSGDCCVPGASQQQSPGHAEASAAFHYSVKSRIKVPIVRIFGSTPVGQKACVHIHGAFPYIFIRPSNLKQGWTVEHIDKDEIFLSSFRKTIELALYRHSTNNDTKNYANLQFGRGGNFHQKDGVSADKTLNVDDDLRKVRHKSNKKRRRRVARLQWVRGTPFYGFNEQESIFMKVYLYSPGDVRIVEQLFRTGLPAERVIDENRDLVRYHVFESHVPFLSQVMMDYDLYGSGFAHFEGVTFRRPLPTHDDSVQDLKYDTPTKNASFDPDMPILSKNSVSPRKSDQISEDSDPAIAEKKMLTIDNAICWKHWTEGNTADILKVGRDRKLPSYTDISWPKREDEMHVGAESLAVNANKVRTSLIHQQRATDGPFWPSRQTTCDLEIDIPVNKILNKKILSSQKQGRDKQRFKMELVPSLRALWAEARCRKRIKIQASYINASGSTPSMPSSLGNKRDSSVSTENVVQQTYRQYLRNYLKRNKDNEQNKNDHVGCMTENSADYMISHRTIDNDYEKDVLEYLPGGQISADIVPKPWPESDIANSASMSQFLAGNSQEDVDYLNDLDRLMGDEIDLSSELMTDVSNGGSLPGSGDLGIANPLNEDDRDTVSSDEESNEYESEIGMNPTQQDLEELDAYEDKILSQYSVQINANVRKRKAMPRTAINNSGDSISVISASSPFQNVHRQQQQQNIDAGRLSNMKSRRPAIPTFFSKKQMQQEKESRKVRFKRKKTNTLGEFSAMFAPKLNEALMHQKRQSEGMDGNYDISPFYDSRKHRDKSQPILEVKYGKSIKQIEPHMYQKNLKDTPLIYSHDEGFEANSNGMQYDSEDNFETQILELDDEAGDKEVQVFREGACLATKTKIIEETRKSLNLVKENARLCRDIESQLREKIEIWSLNTKPPKLLRPGVQTKNVGNTAKCERYPVSLDESISTNSSLIEDGYGMNYVGPEQIISEPTSQRKFQKNKKSAFSLDSGPQLMTIFCLEAFAINKRERKKIADPLKDELLLVAYAIECDDGNGIVGKSYGVRRMGFIAVGGDEHSCSECQSNPRQGEKNNKCTVTFVPTEYDLLIKLVSLVFMNNPDVLFGWEIEKNSWGYIVQRCNALGIPIIQALSRCPLSRINSNNGHDMTGGDPDGTIRIHGRITLSMWRLTKRDATVKLKNYCMENVAWELLKLRMPKFGQETLANWYTGTHRAVLRHRVITHFLSRCEISLDILYNLNIIGRTSEMARLIGIDFYSILWRGSQFRVESVMLRITKPKNFILYSPSKSDVASQRPLDKQALTLEPKSGFYGESPVVVLDFQSLYPSLIIAYNMCYSTCLGTMNDANGMKPHVAPIYSRLGALESYSASKSALQNFVDDKSTHMASNGTMFVSEKTRRGVLPQMLEEILNTRIMVKQELKAARKNGEKVLSRILDARQYALKMISNVTYGYTSASFSGRMPCSDIADAIVQTGRDQLEKAMHVVEDRNEQKPEFNSIVDEIIYGDTDSLFIKLKKHTSIKTAFEIGRRISKKVTMNNYNPVQFNLEKVYLPCILQTKKRYVGWKYESVDDEPCFDDKGIETMRSDQCPVVANVLRDALKALFRTKSGDGYHRRAESRVKRTVVSFWQKMMQGILPLSDYVFSRMLRNNYKVPPPHKIVDTKKQLQDPRAGGLYKEFVQYVIVSSADHSEQHVLAKCAVPPEEIVTRYTYRLNDTYYMRQTHLVLDRMFRLKPMKYDIYRWYARMTRPKRKLRLAGLRQTSLVKDTKNTFQSMLHKRNLKKRGGRLITQYAGFTSAHCYLCNEYGAEKGKYICNKCLEDRAAARLQLEYRVRTAENGCRASSVVCGHCIGYGQYDIEAVGISCESTVCPLYYARQYAIEKCVEADIVKNATNELFL